MSEKENKEIHEVIQYPIESIKIDPDNPNEMNESKMSNLRYSMRRYGFLQPIIIDQNGMLCDGEHRLQVYKELGHSFVPAIQLQLTDDERRLLQQGMNKTRGQHNIEKDINIMSGLLERLPDDVRDMLSFDENALDDLRMKLVEENKEASKLMQKDRQIKDPQEIDEELATQHICPQCGFGFTDGT